MEQHPEADGVAVATRRSYAVVIEWAETNWSAYVPDVPGCVTTGTTVEETIANMREALQAHLEVTREYGEPLPEPRAQVTNVDVTIGAGGAIHTAPEGSTMQAQQDDDAAFNAAGEPIFRLDDGTWVLATHLAYESKNGSVPEGMHVVQSCGNKACMNPAHFRLQKNSPRWERQHTSWHLLPT